MLYAVIACLLIAGINSETWHATIGSTATIVCSPEKTHICKLRRVFQGFVVDRNNRLNDRFSVKDSESCTIEVQNSQMNDSGVYYCIIDNDVQVSFFFSVFVKPNEPQMTFSGKTLINNTRNIISPDKNGNVTFTCLTEQSFPKAIFSWYIDGIVYTNEATEEAHETTNGLWDSQSELTVNFDTMCSEEKVIKCTVYHNSFENVKVLSGTFQYNSTNVINGHC